MHKLAQRRPLPLRNGVAASAVWLPDAQSWPDTLSFLQVRLPAFSRDDLRRRMQAGDWVDERGTALGPEPTMWNMAGDASLDVGGLP